MAVACISSPRDDDPVKEFRRALVQDAFALYCQPIAALAGLVMAYPMGEVLIRLREEEEALLPPGDFLPVLEHYGLMPELDRWVVHQVLRRLATGSRIARFTVNVSAPTLVDRAFPPFLADALAAERMAGNCLLFEIEETDAMALPQCTARFTALVGSLGAGIVIDGFGRTPESLFLLDAPCVQLVKLYGSLTRQLLSGATPGRQFTRILEETSARGIRVIAECVEDPRAFRWLRALGVAYAQGFGVYKARPIEDFIESPALRVA